MRRRLLEYALTHPIGGVVVIIDSEEFLRGIVCGVSNHFVPTSSYVVVDHFGKQKVSYSIGQLCVSNSDLFTPSYEEERLFYSQALVMGSDDAARLLFPWLEEYVWEFESYSSPVSIKIKGLAEELY